METVASSGDGNDGGAGGGRGTKRKEPERDDDEDQLLLFATGSECLKSIRNAIGNSDPSTLFTILSSIRDCHGPDTVRKILSQKPLMSRYPLCASTLWADLATLRSNSRRAMGNVAVMKVMQYFGIDFSLAHCVCDEHQEDSDCRRFDMSLEEHWLSDGLRTSSVLTQLQFGHPVVTQLLSIALFGVQNFVGLVVVDSGKDQDPDTWEPTRGGRDVGEVSMRNAHRLCYLDHRKRLESRRTTREKESVLFKSVMKKIDDSIVTAGSDKTIMAENIKDIIAEHIPSFLFDVNVVPYSSPSFLVHSAIDFGDEHFLRLVLRHCPVVDRDQPWTDGMTPLMRAIARPHSLSVRRPNLQQQRLCLVSVLMETDDNDDDAHGKKKMFCDPNRGIGHFTIVAPRFDSTQWTSKWFEPLAQDK